MFTHAYIGWETRTDTLENIAYCSRFDGESRNTRAIDGRSNIAPFFICIGGLKRILVPWERYYTFAFPGGGERGE